MLTMDDIDGNLRRLAEERRRDEEDRPRRAKLAAIEWLESKQGTAKRAPGGAITLKQAAKKYDVTPWEVRNAIKEVEQG